MTRREVLLHSAAQAGVVWAALAQQYPHHDQAPSTDSALKFFTRDEAREIEAVAAQIIPADETGGAREAGVIRFIDLYLASYEPGDQNTYRAGIAVLAEKSGGRFS